MSCNVLLNGLFRHTELNDEAVDGLWSPSSSHLQRILVRGDIVVMGFGQSDIHNNKPVAPAVVAKRYLTMTGMAKLLSV